MNKLFILYSHPHTDYGAIEGSFTKVELREPGRMVCDGIDIDGRGVKRNEIGNITGTKDGAWATLDVLPNHIYHYHISIVLPSATALPANIERNITTYPTYPIWPDGDTPSPQTITSQASGNVAPLSDALHVPQYKEHLATLAMSLPERLNKIREKRWYFYDTNPFTASTESDAATYAGKLAMVINHFRGWVGMAAKIIDSIEKGSALSWHGRDTISKLFLALENELDYGPEALYNSINVTSFTTAFSNFAIATTNQETGHTAINYYRAADQAELNSLCTEWFRKGIENNYN